MKKGEKKKQQKALKRRVERKRSRKQAQALGLLNPVLRYVRQARDYPIEGCWAQQGWDTDGLAVVVIARRQPNGNIVFGNYLVDYYCLGLKDTYFNADIPRGEFQSDTLPTMFRAGKPVSLSPDLAHEIIYGGIEYAKQFGFRPHDDYKLSQYVLDPPDAHPRSGKVEFGKGGQPFFIAGPNDDVDAIMRQLARTAGEGNYHFMAPIDGPPDEWDEEEDVDISDSPRETFSAQAQDRLDELDLDVGDSVSVKQGVPDPDTGHDIGGWQGRITNVREGDDESILVTIEWDSLTLNNLPASMIEQCEKAGTDWAVLNLESGDVERATSRDKPEDAISARKQLASQYAWIHLGDQGKRIQQVLAGVDADDERAVFDAWDEYLTQHVTFPFEAQVAEFQEHGPLQAGDRVQVIHVSALQDLYGVMVHARARGGEYNFPLCDLEVMDRRSPNYQVVDDYAVWFANR